MKVTLGKREHDASTGIGRLIAAGGYAPTTASGWLHILRHVLKRAKRRGFARPR